MTAEPHLLAVRHEHAQNSVGPAVLLIHGFMSSGAADWPRASWIEPLLAQGRDVIVVDLPGHGDSNSVASAEAVGTARIVEELAALLERRWTDVVGYSLGARLAWALAARHPETVRRAVLGGLSPAEPFGALDFAAARQFFDAGTSPADPLTGFIAGMMARSPNPHSLLNLAQGLAAQPFEPSREAPSAPVLFAAGTDDQMAGGIAALEAFVPGSRTVRVPGDHQGALASGEFRREAFRFLGLSA